MSPTQFLMKQSDRLVIRSILSLNHIPSHSATSHRWCRVPSAALTPAKKSDFFVEPGEVPHYRTKHQRYRPCTPPQYTHFLLFSALDHSSSLVGVATPSMRYLMFVAIPQVRQKSQTFLRYQYLRMILEFHTIRPSNRGKLAC